MMLHHGSCVFYIRAKVRNSAHAEKTGQREDKLKWTSRHRRSHVVVVYLMEEVGVGKTYMYLKT
jgi:predicted ATPase